MGVIGRTVYDWLGHVLSSEGNTTEVEAIYQSAAKVAMTDAAFRIAVNYISCAIGMSDFRVYKNGKHIPKEWNSYLWTLSPNLNTNGSAFINDLIWRMYRNDRAIVIPWKSSIYLADNGTPEIHAFDQDIYRNLSVRGQSCPQNEWKASDLYVFELGNPDVSLLVRQMAEQYGALLQTASTAYRDKNAKKYKLKLDTTKVGDQEEVAAHQSYVDNNLKPFLNADSGVLPEYKNSSLEPLYQNSGQSTMSGSGLSADFINLRKDCFEAVATAMKMPTSMLYGNVNNFKEVTKSFLTFTVKPVVRMMECEITRKNEAFGGWRYDNEMRIDISNIKYNDLFDAAASADKLIASSLLSPDGVLRYLGLDPIGEAWSEKHYMTKNYSPAGEAQMGEVNSNG